MLGTYNPILKPAAVTLEEVKLSHWLDQGAIPSETVGTLLTQVGFTEKYLRARKGEDVSAINVRGTITERKKKTRRMKKATLATAEAAS